MGLNLLSTDVIKFFKELTIKTIKFRQKYNPSKIDIVQIIMDDKKTDLNDSKPDKISINHHQNLNGFRKKISVTDDDIAAEVIKFFFAAFQTSNKLMSFLAYELAMNPDIQEKLRENISQVLKKDHGKFTYENVTNIKYLEIVILGKFFIIIFYMIIWRALE